ncbi:MAG: acylneuraminate cytidylyltransferase family protein [Lachnospiraceae bacterium]|nr:acylneuraminate cytidylyltransferase family protein [Lachnospiraceae bacterium]
MKILFTICGRAGSKGIKGKNVRLFLDYPLVYYTLSAIELYITAHPEHQVDVACNTDSDELVRQISQYKEINVICLNRAPEQTGDAVAKPDVIRDTYVRMCEQTKTIYDVIVDADITSPLRTLQDIENLVERFEETKCEIVYSVVPARRNPYFNMVMKKEVGFGKVIPSNYVARQQAPDIYDMNASLYAYSPKWLRQKNSMNDAWCEVIIMYDTGILDLDHEQDFELMEVIAGWLYCNKEEFGVVRKQLEKSV